MLEKEKRKIRKTEKNERKRLEKELQESEKRLKILFEFAPDGYYLSNLKGNFIDGNKAAEEIIGYKREELIGKNFLKLKLLPLRQIPKAATLLKKNILGQPTGPDEFILNRKDGSQIPIEIKTFPVKIKNQSLVLGIVRDITERKRLEEERARATTARERAVVIDAMPDAVIVLNLEGVITFVNPAYTRMFGWKPEEKIGKSFAELREIKPEDIEKFMELLRELMEMGHVEPVETVLSTKDGREVPMSVTYSLIKDADGNPKNIIAVLRDISELKQLEEERARSEKLAGLGQLAAGVAHEIRNPLGIIATSMYYLNEILPEKRKEVKKHFHIVESEIDRCQAIITNLLEFSRTSNIEVEPVDINTLLNMTLSLVEKDLFGHDIRLIKKMETVPKIKANLDEMKQVFLNLILNATQAMPKGGELRIITSTHNNDKVRIKITDTGIGIPQKDLDEIFNPFFTTKEPGEGTGLGLALVHTIIERYGGTIRVESEEEKGTTFTAELPIFKEQHR